MLEMVRQLRQSRPPQGDLQAARISCNWRCCCCQACSIGPDGDERRTASDGVDCAYEEAGSCKRLLLESGVQSPDRYARGSQGNNAQEHAQ